MKPNSVWVIYGGESSEREVSRLTGKNIVDALTKKKFQVEGIEIASAHDLVKAFSAKKPDIVFIGLHGPFGEDGRVQGFFDTIGVPYVGSGVLSSAICMHKITTQRLLRDNGLAVAGFLELSKADFSLEKLLAAEPGLLGKKLFIKAASEGSTIGVYRFDPKDYVASESRSAFEDFCHKAFHYGDDILIEDWVEGREVTCALIDGEAYPLIEIKPNSKFYDYSSKYTKGQTEYLCPAPIDPATTKKIQESCEKAYRILRCDDYARADLMLKSDGDFRLLEMNTLPGMTATSLVPKAAAARGQSFEDFIESLVTKSFERQT